MTITLPPGVTSSSPPPVAPTAAGTADCGNWFAPDVAVLVCDPAVLASAIRTGSFGSVPLATIALPGRVTGGGAGIAQAVGPPMAVGDTATILLPTTGSPTVFVHWLETSGAEQVAEHAYPDPAGRAVSVRVPTGRGPVFG